MLSYNDMKVITLVSIIGFFAIVIILCFMSKKLYGSIFCFSRRINNIEYQLQPV
jgi:preprotein translocase subunit SecG